MKCIDPYVQGGSAYGCGRCRLCRVSKRSIWTTRIELEASLYPSNVFATLTYNDENLPWSSSDGMGVPILVPDDLKLFMKRLLKVSYEKFGWKQRFFGVGEYGDETWRPHYHAAFFNFPSCGRGETLRDSRTGRFLWAQCCDVCRLVGKAWDAGDVGVGALAPERARYLAGYVTKKLTKEGVPALDGRPPEFSRQSRGGAVKGSSGIGAPVVARLAETFSRYADAQKTDVVGHLTAAGGKKRPLGRYLRNKFRDTVGTSQEIRDDAAYQAWCEQVLPLQVRAKTDMEALTLRAQIIKDSVASEARLKWQEDEYRRKRKGRRL